MTAAQRPAVLDLDTALGAPDLSDRAAVVCMPFSQVRQAPLALYGGQVQTTRHVVLVPTAGSGQHLVNFRRHTLKPGSVVHIMPKQPQRWLPNQPVEGWAIFIEPFVGPPGLFALGAPEPLVRFGSSVDIAHTLVSALVQPGLLPEKSQERLRISIASLLLEFIAAAGEKSAVPHQFVNEYSLITDFRRELEFHYLDTRSVSEYARLIGCSTKTLTRATKRLLDQTPKQMIDARVVYAASRLLANTDISISWISLKLGFSQQSNFSKFFSRQVGVSPAAYRSSRSTHLSGSTSNSTSP